MHILFELFCNFAVSRYLGKLKMPGDVCCDYDGSRHISLLS